MKRTASKVLAFFLVICMMMPLLGITSFAQTTETAHTDFVFTLNSSDNTITIGKYNGTATTVVIPATYNVNGVTYNVVIDSYNIFYKNTKITSVTIKEGVKFKNNSMYCLFYNCTALTSVDISEIDTTGITNMAWMFAKCSALTSIDVSTFNTSKVTTMANMFSNATKANITGFENFDTSSLTNMDYTFNYVMSTPTIDLSKWDLSKLISNIWCFQYCYATSIILPDSLPVISEGCFNHALKVSGTSFTIPAGVKKIGYAHTFNDFATSSFAEFKVAEGNSNFVAVDGILYSADGTKILGVPRGVTFTDGVYEFPEGITFIPELCFSRNAGLKKVILPNSYEIRQYVPVNDSQYIIDPGGSGNLNNGNSLAIAFYRFTGICEYEVKANNPRYTSKDGIIYSKDMTQLVAIPPAFSKYLNVPEGVTTWNSHAIWYIDDILAYMAKGKGAYIPSTLTDISSNQIKALNLLNTNYDYTITVDPKNRAYTTAADGSLVIRTETDPMDLTFKTPFGDDSSSHYAEAGSYIMFNKIPSNLYTVKYMHNGVEATSKSVSATLNVSDAIILPVNAGPNVYTAQFWDGDTMVSETESISIYGATLGLVEDATVSHPLTRDAFIKDTAHKEKLETGDPTAVAMYEATLNDATGVYESSKDVYYSDVSSTSTSNSIYRVISEDTYPNTGRDLTCVDLRFFLAGEKLENNPSSYSGGTTNGRIVFFSSISSNVNTNFSRLYVDENNQLVVYSTSDAAANTGVTIKPDKWYNIKAYLDHEKGTTDYYIDGLLIAKDYYIGGAPLSTRNRAYMPYKDANGFYDKYDWNDFTTFVKEPSLSVQTGSESNKLSIVAKDFDEFISSGYEVRVFVDNKITENVVDFTKGPSTACTISVDEAVTGAQVYIAPVSPDGKILNGIYGPIKSNIVSMNLVPGESESSEYSISATNVAYNGANVTFDLLLQSAEEMKGKAYVAVYENDENDQLVHLNSYTATSDEIDVSIGYSLGQTLKIFWWDSDLTSLCDSVEVQVPNRIFGEDTLEINGVPYIKSNVVKGPFDFEDGNGTVSNFADDSTDYPVREKRIDDFSELTGLEDTEGHGEVFVYDSGHIKLNETVIENGSAVINFDMYYPNGMRETSGQFWSVQFSGSWNKTANSALMRFGDGGIWYNGELIYEVPEAEWVNFGLVIDIEARTYTFVINGEYVKTVDSQLAAYDFYRVYTIKALMYPAEGSEMYIDNFAVYKYLPSYSATVKGVDEDGELIDTLNFEKGSKFAVEFSASMNTDTFAGNVILRRKDGDNVELVDITAADYDVDTKTLYVTINEDLEPKSEYEIVLKANTVDENDNTIYGVCTSNNVSPTEDFILEISSGTLVYGEK